MLDGAHAATSSPSSTEMMVKKSGGTGLGDGSRGGGEGESRKKILINSIH